MTLIFIVALIGMDSMYIHVLPIASVLKPGIPKVRIIWTIAYLCCAGICSVRIAILGIYNSYIHRMIV